MTKRLRRLILAATAAAAAVAVLAGPASAHPLGNFTINHYAEVRVGERQIQLDVVIDMAEIPAFTEQQRLDTNGDGSVSSAELAAAREPSCQALASSLVLQTDGRPMALRLTGAGLQLLPGAGGLKTLRTVCEFTATPARPITGATQVTFEDRSYADRIGWREIVVSGDGTTVVASGTESATRSSRLTHYPTDLLTQPLDERAATISVTPGGPALAPLRPSDAQPLGAASAPTSIVAGAVPGGVGDELAALVGASDLTIPALVISMLIAAGLGAIHAVSPGHGKTVMAAYLVGSQGTPRHAIALGLTVTASHTFGVIGLALLTLLAGDLLPPEKLYPVLGLASGLTVVAIGTWLLVQRVRGLTRNAAHRAAHRSGAEHDHDHSHDHDHEPLPNATGEHSHGGIRHSHAPPAGTTLSWRSLILLGFAGGLVPSASALILLLGAVAAGRPGYGLALAVAFGLGMAAVLTGIGLAVVRAGKMLDRMPSLGRLTRFAPAVPWLSAAVVTGAGIFLTSQALVQRF
jgi:ABC-type nickel/cobalt efflux system permease component RcnA